MRIRMNVVSLFATCLLVGGIWGGLADHCLAALQGYWNYDEGVGPTASDSSGNSNNGTLQNGPAWDTGGVFGGAINLDGLNDYVQVANTSALKYSGGNMTLSTWAYLDSGDSGGYIISKPWNGSGRYNHAIYFSGSTSKSISFRLQNPNGANLPNIALISSAASPSYSDSWHHLAAVVDSSNNMTLYIDGAVAASGTNTITDWTGPDSNLPLALGTLYPYGGSWAGIASHAIEGKLDDTAIWDDALTPPYVTAIYSLGAEPALNYDLAETMELFDLHTAMSGDVTIGGEQWVYKSDLTGMGLTPGVVTEVGDQYFLLLDATSGVATPLIPEPSSFLLLGVGVLGLVRHTRRRRKV